MASPDGVTVPATAHPSAADGSSRRAEIEGKVEVVRRVARELGFDRALLTTRRNFAWLTAGGDNHVIDTTEEGVAAVLVEPDRVVVRTSVIEASRIAEEELSGLDIEIEARPWDADLVDVGADDRIGRYRHPLPRRNPIARSAMVVVVAERAWPRDPDGHPAVLHREDRPPAGAPVPSQSSGKEP